MKIIRRIYLIPIFLLIACSPQSQFEEPRKSSTIGSMFTPTHIENIDKGTPENLKSDIRTIIPPNKHIPTPTSQIISSYPIAGIEAKKPDDIKVIANAGMSWTRRNALQWKIVEPVKGERNWIEIQTLEQEIMQASELGLETILIVRGTPEWAQKVPGISCGPVSEENLIFFGDFLFDAVRRYSQPPYNIKYWELGNEPDVNVFGSRPESPFGCWGDDSDANFGGGYYAEMLKAVYPRIKAADPNAKVLIGGLLLDCDPITPPEIQPGSDQYKDCRPATFLEGILLSGGGQFFDGVAFHAYDYYYNVEGQYGNPNWHSSWDSNGPVLVAKALYIRDLLNQYGYEEKFLVNTEGALLCGRDGTEPECKTQIFSKTKASYIVQMYTIARSLNIRSNIWYNLHGWRGSGLLDQEGKPLIAFDALVFNTIMLEDAQDFNNIHEFFGVTGYSFTSQDRLVWILWSNDGDQHTIQPLEKPDVIYDMMGIEIPPNNDYSVSYLPIYLIWETKP